MNVIKNKDAFVSFITNLQGQEYLSDSWLACESFYESMILPKLHKKIELMELCLLNIKTMDMPSGEIYLEIENCFRDIYLD